MGILFLNESRNQEQSRMKKNNQETKNNQEWRRTTKKPRTIKNEEEQPRNQEQPRMKQGLLKQDQRSIRMMETRRVPSCKKGGGPMEGHFNSAPDTHTHMWYQGRSQARINEEGYLTCK